MKTITLGKSDLLVSPVAFGTWQLGGEWGPVDEASAIAAMHRAIDAGVTLFDTAQAYGFGTSEQLLGRALQGHSRSDLVIATKGGLRPDGAGLVRDASSGWIRSGVDESLRSLGTDYLDLYQVHWPDPLTPFEETAETLAKLVADGKILHVGVSNFDAAQIAAFSTVLPVETLQSPYHLFHRQIEDSVLPQVAADGIGFLAYGPLAHGLMGGHLAPTTQFAPGDWRATSVDFRGDIFERNLQVVAALRNLAETELGITTAQLAIAWTLANPAVHVAIVGTRSPDHIDEAVSAADIDLGADVMGRIDDIMLSATPIIGPSPEAV